MEYRIIVGEKKGTGIGGKTKTITIADEVKENRVEELNRYLIDFISNLNQDMEAEKMNTLWRHGMTKKESEQMQRKAMKEVKPYQFKVK